ncbi:MAG: hypothetical protein ABIH67_00830 [Candidatus Uhrbacteria bacterium]
MSEKYKPENPEQDKSIQAAQELQQVLESHRMLRERLEIEMPIIERSVRILADVTNDMRTVEDYFNNPLGYVFYLKLSRAGFPKSPKLFLDAINSELGKEFVQASAKEKRIMVDQMGDQQRQTISEKYCYQGREIYQAAERLGKTLLGKWFSNTNHDWEQQYGSYNCFVHKEPDAETKRAVMDMLDNVSFEGLEIEPAQVGHYYDTFVHVERGINTDAFRALLGDDYQERLLTVIPADFRQDLNSLSVLGQLPSSKLSQSSAEHLYKLKVAATYNPEAKAISLLADPEAVTVSSIHRDLFHEALHHVSHDKLTAEMLQAKADFIKSVAQSANHFTYYIPLTNARFDHVSGLEEDFVETLAWFFTNPEMLKKKNLERYQAAEQICAKIFPNLDVQEERQKIRVRNKEGRRRFLSDPTLVKRRFETEFAREQSLSITAIFPTISYRTMDYHTIKGRPNESRVRKVPLSNDISNTIDLVSEFDQKGRLKQEYCANDQVKVFCDPEYDEQGRLLSFTSQVMQTQTFYEYQGSDKYPNKATYVSKGVAVYESNFEHQGDTIVETPQGLAGQLPEQKLVYKIKYGRIKSVRGQLQGQDVFRMVCEYDQQGRISSKTYVDEYDRTLLEYNYPYKEQKHEHAA